MKRILSLENISYHAPDSGRVLVDNVSLDLQEGTTTMIIGPNGGGKSTLLKIMAGILDPSLGKVSVGGLPLSKSSLKRAYVPQHFRVSRTVPLTVDAFLKLGSRHYGMTVSNTEIHRILHEWGVCHTQHHELDTLSGGERQRVLMVRALLTSPDILLMDEPAQGLDVLALNEFYSRLTSLNKSITSVIVSHDLQWVMKTAHHVVCLQKHVCCSGSPQDLPHDSHPLLAPYIHHHDHSHADGCGNT